MLARFRQIVRPNPAEVKAMPWVFQIDTCLATLEASGKRLHEVLEVLRGAIAASELLLLALLVDGLDVNLLKPLHLGLKLATRTVILLLVLLIVFG